jgi:hypothetical protein
VNAKGFVRAYEAQTINVTGLRGGMSDFEFLLVEAFVSDFMPVRITGLMGFAHRWEF